MLHQQRNRQLILTPAEGQYPVKLEVKGDGGIKWDYKIINVYRKPEANFFFSDTLASDSSQTKGYDDIKFYNKTLYGSEYSWYFDANDFLQGGQPDSHETNPTWHYIDTGWYHVALVAIQWTDVMILLINPKAIHVRVKHIWNFQHAFFLDASGPGSERFRQFKSSKPIFILPGSRV